MISVIVPVYNVEKYLDKCVNSILSQTYRDFELILVDDGSTDKSGIICDEYAEKDSRVVVIHKKNGGPSEARNEGVHTAEGELITFIDSDDFVTDDYLYVLEKTLFDSRADISAVKIKCIADGERIIPRKKKLKTKEISGREALLNVLYQKDLDTTPCGMLFRKRIVQQNPFPEGKYHEDDYTMYKYFEQASTVVIILDIKYYYIQRQGSIMHQKTDRIIMDEIEAADSIETYFSCKDNDLQKAAKSKKFSNYCQVVCENSSDKLIKIELYEKLRKYLNKEKMRILLDKNTRLKNKVAALLLLLFGIGVLKKARKLNF